MTIPACLEFDKAVRLRKRAEASEMANLVRAAFHADADGFLKLNNALSDEPTEDPDTIDFDEDEDDDWDEDEDLPPDILEHPYG